jgi:dTDP-4-dehydrorhamnose 3,5-epimerase
MKFIPTHLEDVYVIEPKVFKDSRGYFLESYRKEAFANAGIEVDFIQDNHSYSQKGTLRGLHYQIEPYAQAKLIQVISGEIFDVAVDIREGSPTKGRWVGEILSEDNHRMIYIPGGFAHGFVAMKNNTHVLYQASAYYTPNAERGIAWNDPSINIRWPKLKKKFQLSKRDQSFPALNHPAP